MNSCLSDALAVLFTVCVLIGVLSEQAALMLQLGRSIHVIFTHHPPPAPFPASVVRYGDCNMVVYELAC